MKDLRIRKIIWQAQEPLEHEVHQILGMLANGDMIEELLEEYPSFTRHDILACLDYAAVLAEEQVTPLEVLSKE